MSVRGGPPGGTAPVMATLSDYTLVRLDASMSPVARELVPMTFSYIAADEDGGVWAVGYTFAAAVNFGGGVTVTLTGSDDCVLAHYSATAMLVGVTGIGGNELDEPMSLL